MLLKCLLHVIFCYSGVYSLRVHDNASYSDDDDDDYSNSVTRVIQQSGQLIIDTDAGVDDAMAIFLLLNYKDYDVKAITCVRGNTNVFNVAINVQKVLAVAKRPDIPLYVGADFGLIHTEEIPGFYGKDGFGDLNENNLKMTNLDKGHAAIAMAKIVTENPGKVNVICLGPLTNLALACHIQPLFLRLAKSVFIFGGTFGACTISPKTELNFYMDPEAAQTVFQRAQALNRPVIVLPMDVARDVSFDKHIRKVVLSKMKSVEMKFLNRLYDRLDVMHANNNKYNPDDRMISADFYAAAIAINRKAVTHMETYHVEVDTRGKSTRGIFIVDYINLTEKGDNAHVIFSVHSLELDKTVMNYLQ